MSYMTYTRWIAGEKSKMQYFELLTFENASPIWPRKYRERVKGLSEDGGEQNFSKIPRASPFNKIFQMSPLLARSILLDGSLKLTIPGFIYNFLTGSSGDIGFTKI